MKLTDAEQGMLDGAEGAAVQKAMDLLVRYGEALGAERLVETNNVCGTFVAAGPMIREFAREGNDAIFSEFNLDSTERVAMPPVKAYTCHLVMGIDSEHPEMRQASEDAVRVQKEGERFFGARGINMLSTCTPYQVGNVPVMGEHCAWMESSAVVYCNAVLGARTNTEGRESTGAASITGRIPYFGLHIPENRHATHLVDVRVPVDDMMDWGLLGYAVGEMVEEDIPAFRGLSSQPGLVKLKHFGAAAASSGGVEMYHMPGVTPETRSEEAAFAGRAPQATFIYGPQERRSALTSSTPPRLRRTSISSCSAARTIPSSRSGRSRVCWRDGASVPTPRCGCSRRGRSRKSPTAAAIPTSSVAPAATCSATPARRSRGSCRRAPGWWRPTRPSRPTTCQPSPAMALMFLLVIWQWRVLRGRSFQTVTGKGYAPRVIRLGAWRWLTFAACVAFFACSVVLPIGQLLLGSFFQFFGFYQWDMLTLEHYRSVLGNDDIWRAFANTFLLGIGGASATMALGSIVAYVSTRTRWAGRQLIDVLAWLPWMMPGMVLAVGFLWGFAFLPGVITIYGTIWALLVAYVALGTPVAVRVMSAAYHQLSFDLEESASTARASGRPCGAFWWRWRGRRSRSAGC